MSTVHHIEYVMIEAAPLASEDTWITEYDDLPEVFVAALEVITACLDSSSCGLCRDGVGYVLVEDDDYPARLQWRTVWLAREDGGSVQSLCEQCAPIVTTCVAP